ncbi:MAG: CYTH and CHAD domain-containing protein [Rubrivivax sp.]|nr:CYTH and CHAD domain-containing protein [Rubrivivax sp.]
METELKFQVPAPQRAAVQAAVATPGARTLRLQARYFDTADQRLAGAGLALRLRNEGGRWVQALKGGGDGLLRRLEHEVALPAGMGLPALDVARHDGTAAGERLRRALDGGHSLPAERFATDIHRTRRRVRSGGATIEIALDVGWLKAGTRRHAVHELEFELIAGPPLALVRLAERWVQRFGLWWDVRTKAERGQRLARGVTTVPATKAGRVPLSEADAPGDAFAAMVQGALAHALPNLAEIAERGDVVEVTQGLASAEHLHQARVGLRRLRSVLRECAAWSGDEAAARALEEDWRAPFSRLGAARDADVMALTVLPRLQALGIALPSRQGAREEATATRRNAAPGAPTPAGPRRGAAAAVPTLRDQVTSTEVQRLLLRTLAVALGAATRAARAGSAPCAARAASRPPAAKVPSASNAARALAQPSLRHAAAAVLARAHKRALVDSKRFADLHIERQHRVRKRLKRLRYLFELLRPLLGGGPGARRHERRQERLQERLATATGALGDLNDLAVAAALLGQALPLPVQTVLDAERRRCMRRVAQELDALRRLPPAWDPG